ncbi:PEP-CTERM sorting domain-containing protein [Ruficoccus sp. ZRK36]|uniref:PEP-CTERM sorting domain-containing protein n=1 Tax=Ruficoccus sp. ZRK36 TaxID=2866311 RepID=UPI001C72CF93|nr:PEP-CTERM sorting domain-containing protein [Ruficoccus sp. ZRK36]QYY35250.1 PEP-CTERM sorting domain-containing protein [Ruficoccus sp. ZRK36]
MNKKYVIIAAFFMFFLNALHAQISLTEQTYTQDFDSLNLNAGLQTWADNSTIQGWYSMTVTDDGGEVTTDNTHYRASNGNNQTGSGSSVYAFRRTSTDGTLGSLSTTTSNGVFGAQFANNTGSTITSLSISYSAEQWSWGVGTQLNSLVFSYSTDATSLSTGNWTEASSLSFTALYADGTGTALDGTSDTIFNGSSYDEKTAGEAGGPGALNYVAVSGTITGLSVADSENIWIKWVDNFSGETGYGQGLAIDDLNVTAAVPEPSTVALCVTALIGVLCLRRKRNR